MNLNKIKLKRGYFNEEIAELIGIIYGDGNLYISKNNTYRVTITGNKETDYNYLTKYVSSIFKRNFHIKPKILIYKNKKAIGIYINSRELIRYLLNLGLKVGPKKNLNIPKIILKKKLYMARFLRGILDTDFCLYFRSRNGINSYPRVISMFSDYGFTNQLKDLFFKFKIKASICKHITRLNNKKYLQHAIDVSGRQNLSNLIRNINFRNENNLTKLNLWQRDGFCKTNLSLQDRYCLLNNKV